MPFSELALPIQTSDGSTVCFFGVQPTSGELPFLMGDTFFRSAYVVYDLDAKQVAIAQSAWDSTTTNIQEIGPGNDLGSLIGSGSASKDLIGKFQN